MREVAVRCRGGNVQPHSRSAGEHGAYRRSCSRRHDAGSRAGHGGHLRTSPSTLREAVKIGYHVRSRDDSSTTTRRAPRWRSSRSRRGRTAYPRFFDFRVRDRGESRSAASRHGALAGLVAAVRSDLRRPRADRHDDEHRPAGPRGVMILSDPKSRPINSAVFPRTSGRRSCTSSPARPCFSQSGDAQFNESRESGRSDDARPHHSLGGPASLRRDRQPPQPSTCVPRVSPARRPRRRRCRWHHGTRTHPDDRKARYRAGIRVGTRRTTRGMREARWRIGALIARSLTRKATRRAQEIRPMVLISRPLPGAGHHADRVQQILEERLGRVIATDQLHSRRIPCSREVTRLATMTKRIVPPLVGELATLLLYEATGLPSTARGEDALANAKGANSRAGRLVPLCARIGMSKRRWTDAEAQFAHRTLQDELTCVRRLHTTASSEARRACASSRPMRATGGSAVARSTPRSGGRIA